MDRNKGESRSQFSWAGYAAALWALTFACFRIIWSASWYVGLDPEQARIAFAKPAFLLYDIIVACICSFGTTVDQKVV